MGVGGTACHERAGADDEHGHEERTRTRRTNTDLGQFLYLGAGQLPQLLRVHRCGGDGGSRVVGCWRGEEVDRRRGSRRRRGALRCGGSLSPV